MIKAVVFDLDDTLIPEIQYVRSGFHYIAKIISDNYGFDKEKIFLDLMKLFQKSSTNIFNRLFELYKIHYEKETILNLVKRYRNHFPDISFYDDVQPCLEYLKFSKRKIGIITDGHKSAQRLKLEAVGAYNYFDEIIITDELGQEYWKPHPKAYELMREKLDIKFDEMVYVGDNPEKDFYIKLKFPIRTVRVIRGDGIYANLKYSRDCQPDLEIQSLGKLKYGLTEWGDAEGKD